VITYSKFSPRWWLRNPHLQTIVASKLFKRPTIDSTAERIELPDGDFLDLNWSKKPAGAFVCLFHGLGGSIDSGYARGVFDMLEQEGFRPVFMHWRGCSGQPNRLARSYHSGATDDIKRLIELVHTRYPGEAVYAAAFSLGANALLKHLGESRTACRLSGAIAVCPPLVLSVGADKLNSGITKIYQRYLLSTMREHHEAKRRKFPSLQLPAATADLDNFWKFDDALTAPIHGFKDVHDYYEQCSARQYLKDIAAPTHILYALDDPFFTTAVLPDESELNENVTLELSEYGGHVGFIGDADEPRWLDTRIADVLLQIANERVSRVSTTS
jgi:predicted alpha/beta-fold hydrolase